MAEYTIVDDLAVSASGDALVVATTATVHGQVTTPYINLGATSDSGGLGLRVSAGDVQVQNGSGWAKIVGQGPTGFPGNPGPSGFPGDTGNTGARGTQGTQGARGVQGYQGYVGNTANPAAAGYGGNRGATGGQGGQGPQGYDGPPGDGGPTGDTGARGSQGGVGPQGYTGNQGPTGNQGYQGPTGYAGPQGPPGVDATAYNQGVTDHHASLWVQSFTGYGSYLQAVIYTWDAVGMSWNPSDERYKRDITPVRLSPEQVADRIKRIPFVSFRYKPGKGDDSRHKIGIIAQDLQAIDPLWVNGPLSDGSIFPNELDILPTAMCAAQDMITRIDALDVRVQALQAA